ncbi:efflux transporter outer membrane subunit [Burkholderia sp. Ax-1719]|uniref:efflux transporter outer membrane subunit n=1 Tax=Burkholderia sp. Ax-1719 TaxID=2608334 RepID=UPI0014229420|nr:efflux transporter outer membrane subunit [Burkholderia sp. Ax-1719]NIE62627.1 efflux transporter outer membrane subunit [Burkholderia sp. Ax-1719]
MKTLKLAVLPALVIAAGCTMIPKYQRPEPSVASQYDVTAQTQANAPLAADIDWRDYYTDARLQKLIGLALANNRDLRVAILDIESARAQYRIQRADLLPTLSASASGSLQRLPADVSTTGQAGVTRSYSVGGVASYELDLFGRVRSLSVQALQSYLATAETRKATQISLIAEVANAWLTLQADQALKVLTANTLLNQQASLKITESSYRNGVASLLDLRQAQTSVHTAQVNLAQYERQVKQDVNALTLLVGAPLDADLVAPEALVAIRLNENLPAGLPSDLLTRRPDIMSAEHQLLAQNANIGAARAAFFPRIALTASGGTTSASLSDLFNPGSAAWSFGPSISMPIFDYGRNSANLAVAKVNRDIAVATYQKTIQTAFREVSDALDGRATWAQEESAQRELVQASQSAYDLSDERYRQGVDGYLDVLVNQRSLYDAQQNLIKIRLSRMSNTVDLYRVLGGGWTEAAAPITPTAPIAADANAASRPHVD